MQRSNRIMYGKRIGKAVLFVLIFALINAFLCLALEYQEGESEKMLTRYSKAEGIETVVLGNSVAKMLDDSEFTALTGEETLNMCTPDQPYAVSDKLVRMASRQHPVTSVVLLTTFDAGTNENRHLIEKIYDRAENASRPMPDRLIRVLGDRLTKTFSADTFKSEDSINLWIPWVDESVTSLKEVDENLTKRLGRIRRGTHIGQEYEKDFDMVSFERVQSGLNAEDEALFAEDMEAMKTLDLPEGMLNEESLLNLAKLCSYCRDNHIRLSVMITPHRTDYYERYDAYRGYCDTMDGFLRKFVSERGFLYYNFEEDENLHEQLPDSLFEDWEHVLPKHKKKSTSLIAEKYMEEGKE